MMSLFLAHSDFFSVLGEGGLLERHVPVSCRLWRAVCEAGRASRTSASRLQVCGLCAGVARLKTAAIAGPCLANLGRLHSALPGPRRGWYDPAKLRLGSPPHQEVTSCTPSPPLCSPRRSRSRWPPRRRWRKAARPPTQIIQSLKPTGAGLKDATRGIHLANPKVSDESGPAVSLNVQFATGSAELTAQARETLDKLGRALTSQDLAQYHFRIEGHTDTVGTPEENKALSQRRADAVAAYLQQHFGVAADRLQSVGMGEEGLAVQTPPQTANAQNRRVRVVNQDAAG